MIEYKAKEGNIYERVEDGYITDTVYTPDTMSYEEFTNQYKTKDVNREEQDEIGDLPS